MEVGHRRSRRFGDWLLDKYCWMTIVKRVLKIVVPDRTRPWSALWVHIPVKFQDTVDKVRCFCLVGSTHCGVDSYMVHLAKWRQIWKSTFSSALTLILPFYSQPYSVRVRYLPAWCCGDGARLILVRRGATFMMTTLHWLTDWLTAVQHDYTP